MIPTKNASFMFHKMKIKLKIFQMNILWAQK